MWFFKIRPIQSYHFIDSNVESLSLKNDLAWKKECVEDRKEDGEQSSTEEASVDPAIIKEEGFDFVDTALIDKIYCVTFERNCLSFKLILNLLEAFMM